MLMRSVASALILSSLVLGCGDDGGAESTTGPTTNPSTTITTASATETPTDTGDPTGASDSTPTGGSGTDTASGTTTGTGPTATDTTDTTTGEPVTATDSSTTEVTATTGTTTPGETTDTTTDGDTSTGTTTDDGTSSSSEGGDDTTGDVPCDVMSATLKPVIPNIMLVLDKSGSMLFKWDHDADANTPQVTRWSSLHKVVDNLTTNFNDKLNLGANLFPNKSAKEDYTAEACLVNANVEVGVKPKNKLAIMAAIPAANTMSIAGGTPAAGGVTAALNHLKGLPADVPRAMILVTDGAANCTAGLDIPPLFEAYDQSLHTIVSAAYTQDGIPTYVIGINTVDSTTSQVQDGNPNGINPFTKLNELATQGGTAKNDPNEKFYNADNQIELGAALDAVVADALSCVIPLANEPAKPELTEVKINGMEVPKVNDCAAEDGWVFSEPNGPYTSIELCGTACGNLKMVGKADVNFFCVPN